MLYWRKRLDSLPSQGRVSGFKSRVEHAGPRDERGNPYGCLRREHQAGLPAGLLGQSPPGPGPIVYGLGSGVFTPGNGVQVSVGLLDDP